MHHRYYRIVARALPIEPKAQAQTSELSAMEKLVAFGICVALALSPIPLFALAANAATEPNITKIQVLPLHLGMNAIHGFIPDGRDGAILEAWRDNGNAHGYTKFVVMVPAGGKY